MFCLISVVHGKTETINFNTLAEAQTALRNAKEPIVLYANAVVQNGVVTGTEIWRA